MTGKIWKFSRDEDGAVTVDWVVITAAIVGLAVVTIGGVRTATTSLSEGISTDIVSLGEDTLPD